jgi:hypothetical protein
MIVRCLALLILLSTTIAAQTPPAATTPTTAPPALSVYLDCEEWEACDFDFFRTEITAVNWVRDRQVADVHILVTTQQTGAGGREYSVNFLGLRQFAGVIDTLKFVTPPETTRDEKRRGLARVFRLGLVRYLARTPVAERLTVGFGDEKKETAQTSAKNDRWNYWVFRTSLNGYTNGEKTYKQYQTWGSFNADRITERWKTRLSLNNQYSQSDFKIDSVTTFTNIQRGYGGSVLQVKSLTQHWSAGLRVNLFSSTYDNSQRSLRVLPALEYDVFPYSQSTRRQLRLEYNIGLADFIYHDTTIFDKTKERMPIQRLLVSVATREPWGTIDMGVNGTSYLNDRTKYRIGSFTELSLRLFRGFSLRGFISYDVIHDQFSLAKKDFTEQEILTRQFQRGTTYRYFANFGLSYTFGSIFNNVVNPRMSSDFFD